MARKAEGWSLRRDPRTRIWTVIFTVAGRRAHRSTRTRDRKEATKRAAQIYEEVVAGGHARTQVLPLVGVDVVTLCSAWLSQMQQEKRKHTAKTWEFYAATHWKEFFKDGSELCDDRRLHAYVRKRLKEVTRSTVGKECSGLQSLLNWCARPDIGYLQKAPKVPRPPKGVAGNLVLKKIRVDLTVEQVEALIAALPDTLRAKYDGGPKQPCRAFFRVLWETGLRAGTLWRLEAPHDYRKGSSELIIRAEADKSGYARTLDLTQPARDALDSVCPEEGLLFPEINYRLQLRRAAEAIGIPKHLAGHVSPHDFRHARTTHLLDDGAPLTGVAYLVGHKQITTTNLYVHAQRRAAKAALSIPDSVHHTVHRAVKGLNEPFPEALQPGDIAQEFSMGHGGIEPPANGLRVHCSTN